jgi:hypothetical protein
LLTVLDVLFKYACASLTSARLDPQSSRAPRHETVENAG